MKYDINLFIGDKEVEFSSDPKILFNFTETELHNPTIVRNTWTKQIEIDGTSTNNDIFGHIWDLDRYQYYGAVNDGPSFNPIKKVPFQLFTNGELSESGYVKLNTVKRQNNTVKYSITLYGGLGDFFYNLMYDQNDESNTKKTLADLKYTTNDGEVHPDLDFVINKDTINDAWNHINRVTSQNEPRWDVINFIPAYEGKPKDFAADKVLINFNEMPDIWEKSKTEDGVTYQPLINGSVNENGFALGTISEEATEWETFDLRSYKQRPCISMYRIIQACCQPENNGGYQVKLDSHFFDLENPYYYFSYMTLPMLQEGEEVKMDVENISDATLSLSDPTHYQLNYSATTLSSLNNIKLRMGVTFTPNSTTSAQNLYTTRDYSAKPFTLIGNRIIKRYRYNAGVILQLQAFDESGSLAGSSKRYVLSGDKYFPNSNSTLDFWIDSDEAHYFVGVSGYTPGTGTEYLNGYWTKSGSNYVFCDNNGNPTDIDFTLTTETNISRLVVKMTTVYGYYNNYAVRGKGWQDVPQSANTPTYLYTSKSKSVGGVSNKTYDEVRPIDGVMGVFGLNVKSFDAQAYDYAGLYSDTVVTASKLLGGDKTPADYLLSYCKMFGLYFYRDSKEIADDPEKYPSGVVHIMDRDTFYTDEFVDLSDKIDYSKALTITPATAEAKWYSFSSEQVDSQANSEYKTTYQKEYGRQLVNTNYNFNANTTELYDGNAFKAGIMVWEKDKYFKMPTEGVPNYTFNGLKYNLYNTEDSEIRTTEISMPVQSTNGWLNLNTYDYEYYDTYPKLQLHNEENETIDGDGILVTYVNPVKTRATYIITDDLVDMQLLNEGEPCWIMSNSEFDANGNRICYKTKTLPYFTRDLIRVGLTGNIVNSWNFGHPQTIFSPDTFSTENDSIYDKCWKSYINDLYDVNTRKLTCYVKLEGDGRPWTYWFRRFYYFENSIWRLNAIKDLNIASFDVTQMEFIKVQDIDNYKLPEIRWGGINGLHINEKEISSSAQTVTGYVISQSGDRWAMGDYFSARDMVTSAVTYYVSADYISPIGGEGYKTDFTVNVPENSGATPLLWTIEAEDSDDRWMRDTFVQLPAGPMVMIVIEPTSQTVSYSAHTAHYTYTAYNVGGISARTTADWCTVQLGDGTIDLTFADNMGESARTATITLTGYSTLSGGTSELRTATATLTQDIVPPPVPIEIILTPATQKIGQNTTATTITYSVEGGTLTNVGVSCDVDWATATLNGNTITVTMGSNTSSYERTATITLTGTTGNNETARGTATVTQRGDNIEIYPDSIEMDYFANRQGRITVDGGSEWTVTIIDE